MGIEEGKVPRNSQTYKEKLDTKVHSDGIVGDKQLAIAMRKLERLGDINFSEVSPLMLLAAVFIIGMMCKLIGIGGGELLMVVLVVLNIPPIVNSATISVLGTYSICCYALLWHENLCMKNTNMEFSFSFIRICNWYRNYIC